MSCIACVGGRIGHCDCKPMSADKPLSDMNEAAVNYAAVVGEIKALRTELSAEYTLRIASQNLHDGAVETIDRLRARNRKLVEAARKYLHVVCEVELSGTDRELDNVEDADAALRAAIEENDDGE